MIPCRKSPWSTVWQALPCGSNLPSRGMESRKTEAMRRAGSGREGERIPRVAANDNTGSQAGRAGGADRHRRDAARPFTMPRPRLQIALRRLRGHAVSLWEASSSEGSHTDDILKWTLRPDPQGLASYRLIRESREASVCLRARNGVSSFTCAAKPDPALA